MKLSLLIIFVLIGSIFCQINWGKCPPEEGVVSPQSLEEQAKEIADHIREKVRSQIPDPLEFMPSFQKPMSAAELAQVPEPECAFIQVPLNWDNPAGKKIQYFVRRWAAKKGQKKGQVWLQQGGPGGSGLVFRRFGPPMWLSLNGEYDILAPDHRGTGWSTSLDCPQYDNLTDPAYPEWKACVAHIYSTQADLQQTISVTQAVRDMHYAVELNHEAGGKKLLYGVSYGTYFMNRYLQVFPNHPDAVIFDSTCPPKVCRLLDFYDRESNAVGQELMIECARDTFCSSRMPSPLVDLENAWVKIRTKFSICAGSNYTGVNPESFGSILFSLLASNEARALIPALIYRINRCNRADQIALSHFWKSFYPTNTKIRRVSQKFRNTNTLTTANIGISELNSNQNPLPSRKSMEELEDKYYRFRPGTSIFFRALTDIWKPYKTDRFYDDYYTSQVPYLLLQGGLDPQTPFWMGDVHYRNAKYNDYQYYIPFPKSVHGIIRYECGVKIMTDFLQNPQNKIDDSCTFRLPELDFKGEREETKLLAQNFFGTQNLWD